MGLVVHKKTIAVTLFEGRASADVRFYGTISSTPEAIQSMLRKLGKGGQQLNLSDKAGPLGYSLYWLSAGFGHRCDRVAPSLIPKRAGVGGGEADGGGRLCCHMTLAPPDSLRKVEASGELITRTSPRAAVA